MQAKSIPWPIAGRRVGPAGEPFAEFSKIEQTGTYRLKLEGKTVTRFACLAAPGPTHEDPWMNLPGERLRAAIDRKQWLIGGAL